VSNERNAEKNRNARGIYKRTVLEELDGKISTTFLG
jgi:hypothetical protein